MKKKSSGQDKLHEDKYVGTYEIFNSLLIAIYQFENKMHLKIGDRLIIISEITPEGM